MHLLHNYITRTIILLRRSFRSVELSSNICHLTHGTSQLRTVCTSVKQLRFQSDPTETLVFIFLNLDRDLPAEQRVLPYVLLFVVDV